MAAAPLIQLQNMESSVLQIKDTTDCTPIAAVMAVADRSAPVKLSVAHSSEK
jgi:hypothetical protein